MSLLQSFNFVSDIGGILGLFVGFSVMTIAEFLELGLDLAVLNVTKSCGKRRARRRTIDQSMVSMSQIDARDRKLPPPPPYNSRPASPARSQ